MVETIARPSGPYSLPLSTRLAGDATRMVAAGVISAALVVDGRSESARAWQRPDGSVVLRADSDAGIDALRFMLALDDDHTEFLRRFAADPMLGRATRELRGLRPVRLCTVAHALLRAFCGQLITARRARAIERAIIRTATPELGGLHVPPTTATLAGFPPARLRALGLHARRSAALVRVCRELELERLRGVPTRVVVQRLCRERGLGPWSVGVVCLEGLGRYDQGLVGDLGLVKLVSAMQGRWVEAEETAELLEPYGEWAGLASVYLLAAWGRGLLPIRPASLDSLRGRSTQGRDPRRRQDRRVAAFGAAQRGVART